MPRRNVDTQDCLLNDFSSEWEENLTPLQNSSGSRHPPKYTRIIAIRVLPNRAVYQMNTNYEFTPKSVSPMRKYPTTGKY